MALFGLSKFSTLNSVISSLSDIPIFLAKPFHFKLSTIIFPSCETTEIPSLSKL